MLLVFFLGRYLLNHVNKAKTKMSKVIYFKEVLIRGRFTIVFIHFQLHSFGSICVDVLKTSYEKQFLYLVAQDHRYREGINTDDLWNEADEGL